MAKNRRGFVGREWGEANARFGRSLGRLKSIVEDVREPGSKKIVVLLGNERGDITPLPSREGAEIINAMYVVRMGVRIPHGIDVSDTRGQQLESQFGWCIDQKRPLVQFEQGPVPGSLVPDVIRGTDVTVAPDDRHAERGSCPEECESHESPGPPHGVRRGQLKLRP